MLFYIILLLSTYVHVLWETHSYKLSMKNQDNAVQKWSAVDVIRVPMHGSVAQWLQRRSLAGRLSAIYAWSMADMWPLCG